MKTLCAFLVTGACVVYWTPEVHAGCRQQVRYMYYTVVPATTAQTASTPSGTADSAATPSRERYSSAFEAPAADSVAPATVIEPVPVRTYYRGVGGGSITDRMERGRRSIKLW